MAYLRSSIGLRDHCIHRPHETVRAICELAFEHFSLSGNAILAIHGLFSVDYSLQYGDRLDLGPRLRVDHSPLPLHVRNGIVCHTAIVLNLDPAI